MDNHLKLFNKISKIYGLFFKYQIYENKKIFNKNIEELKLKEGSSILDIGCGTGAVANVLSEKGYKVTAIDGSPKMIEVAKKKNKNNSINFKVENIANSLSFPDNSFDLVFCSYVAHGLTPHLRKSLYNEAIRITRKNFLIQDFNKNFNPFISIIEFFEGGDYFNFRKNGLKEMKNIFKSVKVIPVTHILNWYLCGKDL